MVQTKIGCDHAGAGQKGWIVAACGSQITGRADAARDEPEDFNEPVPGRRRALTERQPPLAGKLTSLLQPSLIGRTVYGSARTVPPFVQRVSGRRGRSDGRFDERLRSDDTQHLDLAAADNTGPLAGAGPERQKPASPFSLRKERAAQGGGASGLVESRWHDWLMQAGAVHAKQPDHGSSQSTGHVARPPPGKGGGRTGAAVLVLSLRPCL